VPPAEDNAEVGRVPCEEHLCFTRSVGDCDKLESGDTYVHIAPVAAHIHASVAHIHTAVVHVRVVHSEGLL
jgi:hypothetical protein